MSARAPVFTVERLRGDFFPWVLALVTGLDYFDNAIFSFLPATLRVESMHRRMNLCGRRARTRSPPCSGSCSSNGGWTGSGTGVMWPAACCCTRAAR